MLPVPANSLPPFAYPRVVSIDLSSSQTTILHALVNLHGLDDTAVKGKTIAAEIGRNPGTVRNQMQPLKALQLVEGVAGPDGGYRPTPGAYRALGIDKPDAAVPVPVYRNDTRMPGTSVEEIVFTNVHHPDLCCAQVRLFGSIREFTAGDTIRIGPIPTATLVVHGTVEGRDRTDGILVTRIDRLELPGSPALRN